MLVWTSATIRVLASKFSIDGNDSSLAVREISLRVIFINENLDFDASVRHGNLEI